MTALTRTSDPANEPVTTSEAKDHLRVDISDDDNMIDRMIAVARRKVEKWTSRALITQTWKMWFDDEPGDVFDIPKPPLQSVVAINFTDTNDSTTTVSSSKYRVDTESTPGRVGLKDDEDWPNLSAGLKTMNPVEIEFKAGYGDNSSDVPDEFKQAVLFIVGHLYENRTWVITGNKAQKLKGTVMSLIATEDATIQTGFRGGSITR